MGTMRKKEAGDPKQEIKIVEKVDPEQAKQQPILPHTHSGKGLQKLAHAHLKRFQFHGGR
jgi:hypothetical protein